MLTNILLGILILSFIGLVVMILSKFSLLNKIPEKNISESSSDLINKETLLGIGLKVKDSRPLKGISFNTIMQKSLSKFRILTLKTDYKTSTMLANLRQKQKRENIDNYWKKVKEIKDTGSKAKEEDGEIELKTIDIEDAGKKIKAKSVKISKASKKRIVKKIEIKEV